MALFVHFLCQARNFIFKIHNVIMWLLLSSSLCLIILGNFSFDKRSENSIKKIPEQARGSPDVPLLFFVSLSS